MFSSFAKGEEGPTIQSFYFPILSYFVICRLDGDGWMDTQLQTCKPDPVTGTCKYHLQQKMRLGIRDDTNRPNESPLVLFKPVYRCVRMWRGNCYRGLSSLNLGGGVGGGGPLPLHYCKTRLLPIDGRLCLCTQTFAECLWV